MQYKEYKMTPQDAEEVVPATMGVAASSLDDIEKVRISTNNRLSAMVATRVGEDGVDRGWGLDANDPNVIAQCELLDRLAEAEKLAIKALSSTIKSSALHGWVKDQKGVGDKTICRLLAVVGDPFYHAREERIRTLPELWAYCGLHTVPMEGYSEDDTEHRVAARRRKGQKANWNAEARKRIHIICDSLIKQGVRKKPKLDENGEQILDEEGNPEMVRYAITDWGQVYLDRRAHTLKTHGKPEDRLPGYEENEEWTPGHMDLDAKRILGRELMRALWRESRDYHLKQWGLTYKDFESEPWNDEGEIAADRHDMGKTAEAAKVEAEAEAEAE